MYLTSERRMQNAEDFRNNLNFVKKKQILRVFDLLVNQKVPKFSLRHYTFAHITKIQAEWNKGIFYMEVFE